MAATSTASSIRPDPLGADLYDSGQAAMASVQFGTPGHASIRPGVTAHISAEAQEGHRKIRRARDARRGILSVSGWMTALRSVRVRVESSLASLPPRTAPVLEEPLSIPFEIRFWMLGDNTR